MTESASDRIVAEALSWVGTPYRQQGSRKGVGCDCVGLLLGVWRNILGTPPEMPVAYSPDWAEAGGGEPFLEGMRRHFEEIAPQKASPGDVVLFRWRPHLPAKHAAILTGQDRFVHAYERSAVTESFLLPAWRRRIVAAFTFPETARLV